MSTSRSLGQLYIDLDTALKDFDNAKSPAAQSRADQISFDHQYNYLNSLLKMGLELTKSWLPKRKMDLGAQMKEMPAKYFSTPEGIPEIAGNKSYYFAKHVYVPHLKRGLEVEFYKIEIYLASLLGTSIEKEKQATTRTIAQIEKAIQAYEATLEPQSPLREFNLFSSDVKIEVTALSSPTLLREAKP